MHRTRVKICGVTRAEDIAAVVENGADALGMVFYDKSPRHVSVEQAAELSQHTPAFVTTVALFKDANADDIKQVLSRVDIDLLQFHGSESADFCRQFARPYIKALGMLGQENIASSAQAYQDARGILLDAHAPGEDGGTGNTFDWQTIPASLQSRCILAGGLTVENVYAAVQQVRPYAVDVSSGVEHNKGIKSAALIQQFMKEVKRADVE